MQPQAIKNSEATLTISESMARFNGLSRGFYRTLDIILENQCPMGIIQDGVKTLLVDNVGIQVKTPYNALCRLWSAKYRQKMTQQRAGAQKILAHIRTLPKTLPYREVVALGWKLMVDNRPAHLGRNASGMVKHPRKYLDFFCFCLMLGSKVGTDGNQAVRSVIKDLLLFTDPTIAESWENLEEY